MEAKENGRRKTTTGKERNKHMAMGYRGRNNSWLDSVVDNGSKLSWRVTLALLFFVAYFSDTTLSSIGLLRGVWQHYNPIGVWIYHQFTVFGFILYRILLFYIIYKVISTNIVRKTIMVLLPSAVYIYICAILWDLHSLEYLNIYEVVPWPILKFHSDILYVLFKMFGIL